MQVEMGEIELASQRNEPGLLAILDAYSKRDICPFHMPGHKRNTEQLGTRLPYALDMTEIFGFDNLHNASGILKSVMDRLSVLYGSRKSYILVNGSTGGILAGIRSAVRPGDTIIMARNCHMSVYNAVELNHLRPVFLLPELDTASGINGSIRPEQVEQALAHNRDARLVVLTSPTYEGVVSDIQNIAHIVHQYDIPLLVDAAHGAHFGFSELFPDNPLRSGADIVVCGLHKTLPVLTQCAALHIGTTRVDLKTVERALSIFETSSPSYILTASADNCVQLLAERKVQLFTEYESRLRRFDADIENLIYLRILCHGGDCVERHPVFFDFDPGKIVISTCHTALSGLELATRLRAEFAIETEMAYGDYVIAMTSICDQAEHMERLAAALCAIDMEQSGSSVSLPDRRQPILPVQAMNIDVAGCAKGEQIPFNEAHGRISLEYVWAYPPGIPLLVPGEVICPNLVDDCQQLIQSGVVLHSPSGGMPVQIRVKPEKNSES
jgi:arginine decarboxylase